MPTRSVRGVDSAKNLRLQMQADITNPTIERPRCVETTALGAADLAGLAVGYWKDTTEIKKNQFVDRRFQPDISEQLREKKLRNWKKAVACAMMFENE